MEQNERAILANRTGASPNVACAYILFGIISGSVVVDSILQNNIILKKMDKSQEISSQIKTIGDRATLILGYLVIVLATLTAFIFTDMSQPINQTKYLSSVLLVLYSVNAIIILAIINASYKNLNENEAENSKKLDRLKGLMKRSVIIGYVSIASICGVVISYIIAALPI